MTHETSDDARPDTSPEGTHTGRRAFMAGAAGLAAGATLLGTGSPTGASTTDGAIAPFWVDEGTNTLTPLDLGTGGSATARWVAEGDLCAMTLRIVVGEDADLGTGFWGLDGTTFPVGYRPLLDPPPNPGDIAYQWLGSGFILDLAQTVQASYDVIPMWADFSGTGGPTAGLLWFPAGLPGTPVRLGDGGTAPFGTVPNAGTHLFSTTTYRRVVPEPE